jgi:hypothetical protein
VRRLLEQILGITAVEMRVNFQTSWHQRHPRTGCAVRPWHRTPGSMP